MWLAAPPEQEMPVGSACFLTHENDSVDNCGASFVLHKRAAENAPRAQCGGGGGGGGGQAVLRLRLNPHPDCLQVAINTDVRAVVFVLFFLEGAAALICGYV